MQRLQMPPHFPEPTIPVSVDILTKTQLFLRTNVSSLVILIDSREEMGARLSWFASTRLPVSNRPTKPAAVAAWATNRRREILCRGAVLFDLVLREFVEPPAFGKCDIRLFSLLMVFLLARHSRHQENVRGAHSMPGFSVIVLCTTRHVRYSQLFTVATVFSHETDCLQPHSCVVASAHGAPIARMVG